MEEMMIGDGDLGGGLDAGGEEEEDG